MGRDAGGVAREPWFSARCVSCDESPGRPRMDEARAYVAVGGGWSSAGFLDLFHPFDATVGHGTEVFSPMRTSDLDVGESLDAQYDTGSERRRRDGPGS